MDKYEIRFWSHVAIRGVDDCWLWTRCTNAKGYGLFSNNGKTVQAHRQAYAYGTGTAPGEFHVLHRCDTPGCCNPRHLFLGTNDDNMADRDAKGRGRIMHGSQHGRAKLTESDVRAIRRDNRVQREIAEDYGVDRATISEIKAFKIWKHVLPRFTRSQVF